MIDIVREVVDNHQLTTLGGNRDQLLGVIEELNTAVQDDVEQPWFADWADQFSVAASWSQGGGAAPRRQRDRGDRDRSDRGAPRRSHGSEEHKGCTIFVGRLGQSTTVEGLKGYFEQFGAVIDADVRIDNHTGRSKGFGFITFNDQRCARNCLERRDEHKIDGRWVDVKPYDEEAADTGTSHTVPAEEHNGYPRQDGDRGGG